MRCSFSLLRTGRGRTVTRDQPDFHTRVKPAVDSAAPLQQREHPKQSFAKGGFMAKGSSFIAALVAGIVAFAPAATVKAAIKPVDSVTFSSVTSDNDDDNLAEDYGPLTSFTDDIGTHNLNSGFTGVDSLAATSIHNAVGESTPATPEDALKGLDPTTIFAFSSGFQASYDSDLVSDERFIIADWVRSTSSGDTPTLKPVSDGSVLSDWELSIDSGDWGEPLADTDYEVQQQDEDPEVPEDNANISAVSFSLSDFDFTGTGTAPNLVDEGVDGFTVPNGSAGGADTLLVGRTVPSPGALPAALAMLGGLAFMRRRKA